jgi:uncharacterized protein
LNAFIFHGTYGNPNENWFPWMKKELKCEVIIPEFPSPENQSLESWNKAFNEFESKINSETIFVAHSLGVAFALHLLEKNKIKSCFFISGFLGSLNNEKFDELNKSFMKKFNWNKIKSNCEKFIIIYSDNDPFVPQEKAIELKEKLNAELILIRGAGHFNESAGYLEFPELLEKIKEIND